MNICNFEDITNIFYGKTSFEDLESVRAIINHVRENKDKAVIEYAKQFDHEKLKELRVSEDEIDRCYSMVDKITIKAIKYAINNVKEFAKCQLSALQNLEVNIGGNILGHKIIPLDSVGCYVPGGNYPLPSSAIMTITPAKVAGVKIKMGTHTMRKTFGFHFYQQTKDVALLQVLFNHSSPSVTLRYIGINQNILDKAMERFCL